MLTVTTQHSTYELDLEKSTWKRIAKTPDSGTLRSEEGEFNSVEYPVVGGFLCMLCPPFVVGGPARCVISSRILTVEEK